MNDGLRTHRDTVAFVLAMTGATMWAMFPAAAMLGEDGLTVVIIAALIAGAGGGLLFSGLLAFGAAVVTAVAHGLMPAPPPDPGVPAAHVVER